MSESWMTPAGYFLVIAVFVVVDLISDLNLRPKIAVIFIAAILVFISEIAVPWVLRNGL